MEFSESFAFGNSTFMKLESQANHAIKDVEEKQSPSKKPLDVILESPTRTRSGLSAIKSKSRYIQNDTQCSKQQQTSDCTQRRKFRRSKSDSTLPKVPALTKDDHCDNYSEFFKSDFSIGHTTRTNKTNRLQSNNSTEESSYLRVSQIEAAFGKLGNINNDVDEVKDEFFKSDFSCEIPEEKCKRIDKLNSNESPRDKENAKTVSDNEIIEDITSEDFEVEDYKEILLDKPIFSEDLKDIILSESVQNINDDLWQDTLPLSNKQRGKDNQSLEDPQMVLHDVSSFLYKPQENTEETIEVIKTDLKSSRKVFQEYVKPELHNAEKELSLSNMSPNQLQFTQNLLSPSKSKDVSLKKRTNKSHNDSLLKARKRDSPKKSKEDFPLKSNIEDLKSIASWNLPKSILMEYERKGVQKMFDWQIQCLNNPKVLFEHRNLVYSAPTSAGKTLVSEILLLKTVLERGKKVILILPFISVVREKMFYLQDLLTAAGYRVEGFFGGYSPPGGFESINVAICTIEKANSIVNRLLEQGKLDDIGTVIVDEVHLISDPGRGYILELLLAKILYMSRKYGLNIQIVTMSATLANVELLTNWLDAEAFVTNFRPVALQEMIKVGNKIYDNNLTVLRAITEPSIDIKEPFPSIVNDADHVAQLCMETLVEGCSVLVFCPSKDWCENLTVQLAGAIHALGKQGGEWGTRIRMQIKREAIAEVKKQLKDIPTGLDSVLEKTVSYACAFHHAGLTTEERDIVEASFKAGTIKIIVATSTLSSGVNLPARRVLIRSPLFGGKQMNPLTYRQMIGRAGRTGKDTLGESILICADTNARIGKELITAGLKPLCSCLEMDSSTHLKRALLEVISSGVATSKEDIDSFVNCTLLSVQKRLSKEALENEADGQEDECIESALDFLIEYEFVRLQKSEEIDEQIYVATRLGLACLASSLPPTDGLILFAELQKSRRCFVLESELHAVYLVTPYSVCYQLQDIDWLFFLDLWEKLTPAMKKVGELVGVKESFLVRAMRGQTKLDYKLLQIHKRFYTALALQELVNEAPINVVAAKFKCTRGMLQSLQQMASTFAGIVASFCSSLQWDTLSLIVSQFKERLFFGIHRDLIDLMRIPDLNQKRARALFDAGITSLVELASSDVASVEKTLYNALSFDSAKQLENENAAEAAQRNEARNLYITGKSGITVGEAAKLLIQEARQFLQYEIGVGNINWSQKNNDDINTEMNQRVMHMSFEENKYRKEVEVKTAMTEIQDKCNANGDMLANENASKNENHHKQKENCKKKNIKPNMGLNTAEDVNDLKYKNQNKELEEANSVNIKSIKNKTSEVSTHIQIDTHQQKAKQLDIKEQTLPDIVKHSKITPASNTYKKHNSHSNASEEKVVLEVQKPTHKDQHKKSESIYVNSNEVNGVKNGNEEEIKLPQIQDKNTVKIKTPVMQRSCEESQGTPTDVAKIKIDNDEKPSTSKKALRLLKAKQLSEIKKKEWAKRQVDTEHKNDNKLESSEQKYVKDKQSSDLKILKSQNIKEVKKPALAVNAKESPKSHLSIKTPSKRQSSNSMSNNILASSENVPEKLPRRSPRNIISSTRIEDAFISPANQARAKKKSDSIEKQTDELFGNENDEPFILNTDIENALQNADAENFKTPSAKSNLNKTEDEIPSSQQIVEDVPTSKTNSPHASRFLRSIRATQRIQTPVSSKKLMAVKILPPQEPKSIDNNKCTPVELFTSANIEFSDISLENSLMKNPMHLNASHILSCSKIDTDSSSFKSIDIIDICGDQQLFKGAFKEFMAQKRLGVCLGIQQQSNRCKPVIGANLLINQVNYAENGAKASVNYEYQIDDTYYLAGVAICISDNLVYFMNMQAEGTCNGLTAEIKGKYLRMLLRSSDHTLVMYDAKEQLKLLRKLINDLGNILASFEDPKVANWLLQPDKMHNLHSLAQQFAPECSALVNLCGNGRGYNSYGLDSKSAILAKVRCSIESCVTIHILKGQIENLERIGSGQLFKFFKELEMPLQVSLCDMEDYGFPANSETLHKLFQQMVNTMKKLETKIYELHGSKFNLGSSSAVAKVLGLHRKSNGRISTSKQILEKIDTPISQMIILYRKLSATLTNNIQPLLKSVKDDRIHGSSITFTSTGRISMTEPNLQNVAKDYTIDIASDKFIISCRSAFFPSNAKRCLISSDFCQLEMRILAHLSQDTALLDVINSEKDIFVAIAARWNKISENSVTEQMRNGTKQICYGIVYGMGMRALAEGLKCTEHEAKLVTEQFHAAYAGIRTYTEKIVKFARNNGYIETITGRRRYLENINSEESSIKSQAERQAVNTTIQGSAADIAKSAILRMEKNVVKYRDKLGIDPQQVRLVLHLHDELIFEVPTEKAKKIAKVLSVTMENCVKLNVPLKVKLRIGKSWGDLQEIKL